MVMVHFSSTLWCQVCWEGEFKALLAVLQPLFKHHRESAVQVVSDCSGSDIKCVFVVISDN